MIDLNKDLSEARDILEGATLILPEVRHLRALQVHHEDTLIQAALKVARVHDEIFDMP